MPTKIEWTDESWNPIRAENRETGGVGHFCVHKSAGCANCYAEPMQPRLFKNPVRYAAQDREKVTLFLDKDRLHEPLGWRKPKRVFVCSMTDLFLEHHSYDWLIDIWANMGLARKHQFQVLTKRPEMMRTFLGHPKTVENIRELYEAVGAGVPVEPWEWPFPNVWCGVSVEDNDNRHRLHELEKIPAAVRFASIEPLLGPVDLYPYLPPPSPMHLASTHVDKDGIERLDITGQPLRGLDWVIVGGESGAGARPMHPDWARAIRDQCVEAGVAFHFKQHGEWIDWSQTESGHWTNCSKQGRWRGAHYVLPKDTRHVGKLMVRDEASDDPNGEIGLFGDRAYETIHSLDGKECCMLKVGKKRAGRMLDGRTWDEFPS